MIAKLMIGAAAACALLAGQPPMTRADEPPITRTELLRADLANIEGKEVVLYIADVKPGGAGGKHTHYGDEFVYVVDGALVVEPVGKAAITLRAGEVGHLTPDIVHAARNGSPDAPAKVLVILVVDKGKPLAEAVK